MCCQGGGEGWRVVGWALERKERRSLKSYRLSLRWHQRINLARVLSCLSVHSISFFLSSSRADSGWDPWPRPRPTLTWPIGVGTAPAHQQPPEVRANANIRHLFCRKHSNLFVLLFFGKKLITSNPHRPRKLPTDLPNFLVLNIFSWNEKKTQNAAEEAMWPGVKSDVAESQ